MNHKLLKTDCLGYTLSRFNFQEAFSALLTMLERAIAKAILSVCLSVRHGHTIDSRLDGAGYRNTFHATFPYAKV